MQPTRITQEVIEQIDALSELAPLHNPPALKRIREFQELLPDVPLFAVFDTAFHSTMPPKAYIYSLPYKFYKDDKIRKYGFHGISHQYVSERIKILEPDAQKLIICHLGGGASVTAVRDGKSVDTSMGFTPLEGLTMATRAGDVDDGVIYYLMDKLDMTIDQINNMENKESGLLGISGKTSDMRTLLEMEAAGNERAHLAIEIYVYDVLRYIGSYAAALGGIDVLALTAGVGAGSDVIRARICETLGYLDLKVDHNLNDHRYNVKEELKISSFDSKPIWVIPTNEELEIARQIQGI